MATVSQSARFVAVNTPLGEEALLFYCMSGSERLSELFDYELDLLSEQPDISLKAILGQNITVRLELPERKPRFFNGFVSRFVQHGTEGKFYSYRAILRPWLWFLTRTSDCRIFQNQTVPEIIRTVFRDHGLTDFEERLNETYDAKEYCVQYRETAFAFVSRLMEQEGVYYYFRHDNGQHFCVLSDSIGAHDTIAGYESLPYFPPDNSERRNRDHIYEWSLNQQLQACHFALNDFDFKKPGANLYARSSLPRDHAAADFEHYEYPGEYSETSQGDSYSRLRIEEHQSRFEKFQGVGNAAGLSAGALFRLIDCPRNDQNREYLVTSTYCVVRSDDYHSAPANRQDENYWCSFEAIDSKQAFRAPRTTPRPVVSGPQTAIVVGKAGEELWLDKYGRVKVQFHWDREGKADENSSCWIRVSQPIAGKGWGSIALPRIGQEVIVDFLEGDPDRPIITGRVYNHACMPPYALPENKTISTFKSSCSRGGGGFNELRFEDKIGEEEIFVHAEKNQNVRVKNDAFERIGHQRHSIVDGDQMQQVDGDNHSTVKGDRNYKVNGTVSMDIGQDLQQKVRMKQALDAGMEIHLKAGMNVVIEAGASITLKAGGGFITVGPEGVALSGTPILINSGGAAGIGSGCAPDSAIMPIQADPDKSGQIANTEELTPNSIGAQSFSSVKVSGYESPQAQALVDAAQCGQPFCAKCEASKNTAVS